MLIYHVKYLLLEAAAVNIIVFKCDCNQALVIYDTTD